MDDNERACNLIVDARLPSCSLRLAIAFSVFGFLAGCAAGPDFKQPPALDVSGYTAEPLPSLTASSPTPFDEAQSFDAQGSVDAKWWHRLGSTKLDALIEESFRANPALASAHATLRQAQEIYASQAGSTLYPRVGADLGAQRQRTNPNFLGQEGKPREFSLYNAGVRVGYQFDLAGGNRRSLEALAARSEYRRFEYDGAKLALAGNIVITSITLARLNAQIEAMEAIIHAQDEQVLIARTRLRLGQAMPDEVSALQTQAEQTRAELPQLRKQFQQSEHLLAVLAGRAPGATGLPTFTLEEFTLPAELPLTLPSELVHRRPDIQAAEALLHAANAEYGVAVAKMYPQVNISANLSSQALSMGALFGSGSAVWSLIGQLTQPLFDPGLPAEKRAALAAFDAAAANYQSVVLESLRNVADILRAIEQDAHALVSLAAAETAAQQSVESIRRQHQLGAVSYAQLLIVEQQEQQNRINLIAAQAQRLVDSAALYQALGGGAT